MTIDDFISIVAPKMPGKITTVYEKMRGSELKLTGHKEWKGEPIEDDKIYRTPIPVGEKVNHEHKLRLAWLRGGKRAVATYMRKFMKVADVEKAIKVLK